MNINEIKELLVTIDKTKLEFVKLKNNDLSLEVSKRCGMTIELDNADKEAKEVDNDTLDRVIEQNSINTNSNYITAPLMGTFYTSPSPTEDSFVKVGDVVEEGDVLCILEAMKLMNEITSEEKGEIIEILVQNEDLVEYNQPLFKIKPI